MQNSNFYLLCQLKVLILGEDFGPHLSYKPSAYRKTGIYKYKYYLEVNTVFCTSSPFIILKSNNISVHSSKFGKMLDLVMSC